MATEFTLSPNEVPEPGSVTWRSPSNIALIKYWGKHGIQLPRNPSLSFTLAAACTDTKLAWTYKTVQDDQISLDFYFHEVPNEAFGAKTKTFLQQISQSRPFLRQLHLSVHTGNSFPHSAGIASSASGMSALALCLCSLEDQLFGTLSNPDDFDRQASEWARLGSGSACRSIYPYAAVWGETPLVAGSSDRFAVPIPPDAVHEAFRHFHDDILIVSAEEKAVSSRAGHALMEGNPFAPARYAQANEHLAQLLTALRTGDLPTFGRIVEDEALTLHALMMCSTPSYLLMRPNTLAIIEKVRQYRADTGYPVFFTLDAGPNVHLLYPSDIIHDVRAFIDSALLPHCENGWVIQDWVGEGAVEI